MEDYAANSYKAKREAMEKEEIPEKKVQKVVTGKVTTKKKSGLSKFAGVVIQEDVQNVKKYIFSEVLIPALKKAISDVVRNGIDMLLYGETGKSKSTPGSKVSYNSMYDDRRSSKREPSYGSGFDYDEFVFETRGDAEFVLGQMEDILSMYPVVSVADFYDLLGITPPHTANKYGWTDLRSASVSRVRNGHVIKLPRALPID